MEQKMKELHKMNMNYDEFSRFFCDAVVEKAGPDASGYVTAVQKPNMYASKALIITMAGRSAAPVIYLDPYYDDYQKNVPIQVLTDHAIKFYTENYIGKEIDTRSFRDFSKMKKCVSCRVIDAKRNAKLLAEIPHRLLLDMAVVYYLAFPGNSAGNTSILVKNEHMKIWKVTEEQLYDIAIGNMVCRKSWRILTIGDILAGFPVTSTDQSRPGIKASMYILTNENLCYGAGNILIPEAMDALAQKFNDDIYVLPSSLHEVIAVSVSAFKDRGVTSLRDMVSDINDSYVSMEDVLTSSVYRYYRTTHELVIAE
ncbi:MAG: DUF5688 family protein [Lachnospiraceae bacterium]|nr:DUF5688 family protein [Lachnospiraceae bacterium]